MFYYYVDTAFHQCPIEEAFEQMPGYAYFMKDMVTKKRSISFEDDDQMQHCNAIATRSLLQKKE